MVRRKVSALGKRYETQQNGDGEAGAAMRMSCIVVGTSASAC
jgi:hypothetical protein